MKKNFLTFARDSTKNLTEALINLFVFFAYFFSVITLLKTLFFPWKNLVSTEKPRAFSFQALLERLSFNLISSAIGFISRLSVIVFYLLLQIICVAVFPIIFLAYFLLIPFFYLFYLSAKTETEIYELARKRFVKDHLLNPENAETVHRWFADYWPPAHGRRPWWKLSNLLSYPPLARDWAVGYTPLVDQYADELTTAGYQQKIRTAYDRESEIKQIERILSKSAQANVIIVGDDGVGKHTIVDTLAKKIYEGKINSILAYKRILRLNMEKILNRFTDQKQRETFLEDLLREGAAAKNIIFMIENFDRYVIDQGERVNLTIPLEKYGKTENIQIIAISEPFLYQKFIYGNEKINRIFEKVDVYEIKKNEVEKILFAKFAIFENRYKMIIPYETIRQVIDKSDFFITDIPFPEKAIELLDMTCVDAQRLSQTAAVKLVLPELVDKVLTEKTHITTSLTDQIRTKLINLEPMLSSMIIQQNEAIKQLSGAIRRSFILLGKRKKPLASFIFFGPTGVGKTATAKALSQIFFGSEKYLIRFDMTNYQSKNDIPSLLELMTVAVRQNPFGVLLLDEIEKADRDLVNIFLSLTDEGYFTNHQGQKVDCKNLVVIATSNAASDQIYKNIDMDFVDYLIEQKIFSPEFLNRFDGVIVFKPLTEESFVELAKKYIAQITEDIYKLYKVKLTVGEQFLNTVVKKGFDQRFGARQLERITREEIEDKVAKLILEKKAKEGDTIVL